MVAGLLSPAVELLLLIQKSNYVYDRPLWQALAGAAYVLGAITTLLAVAVYSRPASGSRTGKGQSEWR